MPVEIPFIRPSFPKPAELADEFEQIVRANWYTNFGPKERQFGLAISEYLGSDLHVATFANATLALIAALKASIGPGRRDRYILMPSFTFVAVAQAAIWAGYRPWFIDIDPETWQPSTSAAESILECFRDEVAGIVLANVFGVGNTQIRNWEHLADKWRLPLVIDSAAGFGSAYPDGERLGRRGRCEVFSFHATKPFAIGEGGAMVSRDPRLIEQAQGLADFGFTGARSCTQVGINGKMQEICAAIGLRQLTGFDDRLKSRRNVFECYRRELAGLDVRFQPNADVSSVCFASVCCTSANQKRAVLAALRRDSICAHDYYNPPQHMQPIFSADRHLVKSAELAITEDICSRIVSLPVHDYMAPQDVARVVSAFREGALNA
ncbi:DegT/DnrJ/EryC1/StrS family aminotransferase [Mycobacterium sp. 1274761.0]|uniref:DegT/DnrJ/EryC1/StrS family aminotransferase n=1 Tax=Mycobacterium sp. 1274761.0 TaxID=1834077 RepID=UPI0007FC1AA3|nr:DegT/DnrJ/EryC1/StrS family aminotransferase [Mycobacterium sp. 1274761.0]OBK79201.1 hypothetical protein A5651_24415 [Mycobacterium sp. 1274761.0]